MHRNLLIFLSIIAIFTLKATIVSAMDLLKIPLQYDNLNLDPAKYPDTDSIWVSTQIYEGLFELSPTGDIKPRLAIDWQLSRDGKSLKLFLRKKVRFSDGSPLTSKDVAFTLTRLKNESKREAPLLNLITKITIINDNELKLEFVHPIHTFTKILSSPHYYILPAKHANAIRDNTFFLKPIGTGPYKIKEWQRGKNLSLDRNPYHWDKKVQIERINFHFEDKEKPWSKDELLKFDLQLGIPAYSLKVPKNFQTQWYNHPIIEFLGFNLRHQFWSKKKNRQAFAKIFNKERYYKTLFKHRQKSWHLTNSVIPYGMLGSSKIYTLPQEVTELEIKTVKNYLTKHVDGIYFASHDHLPDILLQNAIESALKYNNNSAKKIGYTELWRKVKNNEVGFFIMRLAADSFDPFEILVYFSKDTPSDFTGYKNTNYTDQLRKAHWQQDDSARIEIYTQLAKQLNKELVIIPLATMFSERLFVRESCRLNNIGPLGPRYYRMSNITCK